LNIQNMAITKKPSTLPAPTQAVEQFIERAPDGVKSRVSAEEKDGVQITLRMSREQLERLTQVAARQGIPRASYIKRAVFIQLESDEKA
jgi:predicted DNA binding CopG/RHH family protein